MKKTERLVQVLHKMAAGNLAVGKVFEFNSGSSYRVMPTGAIERTEPKPYRNKAGRKRWLKERRADRGLSENEAKIARFKREAA